jgi:hypothetical protein
MKTIWLLVYFPLYIATSPCVARAQGYPGRDADVEASRRDTSLIIADIRPKLFGDLRPSEAAIYEAISFDVSDEDKIMNAYAYRSSGARRITFTEAMGRAIKLNVDAMLIEQFYQKPRFLGDYLYYVCTRYAMNADRSRRGLSPERIASPYERVHWADRDLREFYSEKDVNSARAKLLGGSFAFLLAHEVAHQVLGHVDNPTRDIDVRRQLETDADAWAINLLVEKNVSPVSGIVPMLFFYYTTQHPVASEIYKDHPADVKRMLAMFTGLNDRLPKFRASIEASGQSYDDVRKTIGQALVLVKQEIDEDR